MRTSLVLPLVALAFTCTVIGCGTPPPPRKVGINPYGNPQVEKPCYEEQDPPLWCSRGVEQPQPGPARRDTFPSYVEIQGNIPQGCTLSTTGSLNPDQDLAVQTTGLGRTIFSAKVFRFTIGVRYTYDMRVMCENVVAGSPMSIMVKIAPKHESSPSGEVVPVPHNLVLTSTHDESAWTRVSTIRGGIPDPAGDTIFQAYGSQGGSYFLVLRFERVHY